MAGIKAYKKLGVESEDLNKVQEYVSQAMQPVLSSAIVDGVLLKNVSLTTGSTTVVEHKLGRAPQGWLIVRQRAQATIWDSQDSNRVSSRTLALECSANVVVDLWVF